MKINANRIKFKGIDINTNKQVTGMLLSSHLTNDLEAGKVYYLIGNENWDLEAQFNYLKDPIGFSHCAESIGKIIPETLELIIS